MHTILLTGASGNVGLEIIKNFSQTNDNVRLLAGVRDKSVDHQILEQYGEHPFILILGIGKASKRHLAASILCFYFVPHNLQM